MRSSPARLAVLFAALAMVGAACSSKSNTSGGGSPSPSPSASVEASASASASESEGGTITVGSDTANNHGSKEVGNVTSVEVEMDDFYFEPTVLTGNPGDHFLGQWFLAHGTRFWAGDFSLVTPLMNSPDGINLMANASLILPGSIVKRNGLARRGHT